MIINRRFAELMVVGGTASAGINPLHIFCRLRDIGIDKEPAIFLCKIYEGMVFRTFILRGGNGDGSIERDAYRPQTDIDSDSLELPGHEEYMTGYGY